jgi:hypothetical protein
MRWLFNFVYMGETRQQHLLPISFDRYFLSGECDE